MTCVSIRRGIEREKIPTEAAYQRQFLPQFLTRCQNRMFRLTGQGHFSARSVRAKNVFDFGTARAQDGPRLAARHTRNAWRFSCSV